MLSKKRDSPSFGAVRVSSIFLVVFGFLSVGYSRDRGPRVEVVCPSPPIPVRINKGQVLVYELHVTNFDTVPLTLKQFEVFANEESSGALITLADSTLSAAMRRVGEAMMPAEPGGRDSEARV